MPREKKKLGAWFPKASVIKGATYDPEKVKSISLLLFYQYSKPQWSESRKLDAVKFVESSSARLNLGGRVRVACEGLNATISGPKGAVVEFTEALKEFDKVFNETDFKFVNDMPLDRAFPDLKVLPVKELVFYGLGEERGLDTVSGGTHLEPQEYHEKLSQASSDTIVIDVRNAYESDIGRFGGQASIGGAELLDPGMRKSTDFVPWLAQPEVREKLKGKEVLMYCTGGVRCERASSLLQRELGDQIKGCFQLQGGIEKYLMAYPEGGHWQGKNFVFDKREAFGVGDPAGVGGVVKPQKKKKTKAQQQQQQQQDSSNEAPFVQGHAQGEVAAECFGRCSVCAEPWDRYIGKKKCSTCQVPLLVCPQCLSGKKEAATPKQTKGNHTAGSSEGTATTAGVGGGGGGGGASTEIEVGLGPVLGPRCPLCVSQGVVVPASALGLTDNGKSAKVTAPTSSSGGGPKAASTVCKWGGGHSSKRDKKGGGKRKEVAPSDGGRADGSRLRQMSAPAIKKARAGSAATRTDSAPLCRYGAECKRADCYFRH